MGGTTAGHSAPVGSLPTAPEVRAPSPIDLPTLYREEFDYVWRVLRRLGVPIASIDDAVQDVFLVVYRRLDEFCLRGSGRGLLMSIALRVARDHRRRGLRKGGLAPLSPSLRDPAPGPFEKTVRREAAEVALQLLETLDDEKREIFVLSQLEGLSAPEIGEQLELNVNTVYSRMRAARLAFEAALQARLNQEGT